MAFPPGQCTTRSTNSILVTVYLTKIGIKTVPHPPYIPNVAPCDFWLFPKLRGCRYETIEEMKEAVTKVIDTFTQEDIHGTFQKLLERYNKCIAAGGDNFKGDLSFMGVLSIKVPIRKSLETYLMILVYTFIMSVLQTRNLIAAASLWWQLLCKSCLPFYNNNRHDWVGKVIHWELCKKFKIWPYK